jgi:hypothetical protein
MKIRYIRHAIEQIRERGISKRDIEEAVMKGQERYVQVNGRIKCIYKKKNKTLIVIYKQDKENYKIITAFHPYEN